MPHSDPLNFLLAEVRASAAHSRSAILVTHGVLELIVNTLIRSKCKNAKQILDDPRTYSHASRVLILHELHVLYDQEKQLLDRFRKLRNDVVHDVLFKVTNERIVSFGQVMPFPFPHDDPATQEHISQNLVVLCVGIVAQVWGRHVDELRRVFPADGIAC